MPRSLVLLDGQKVRRRGFALMLILYSIGRFLMELIRIDEKGQLGTGLTISQLISVAMIILGISLLALARRPNAKPVLPA